MKAGHKTIHISLLISVIAFFIWSMIKPWGGYGNWALEAGPSLLGILILMALYKRFRFTTLSYCILAVLFIFTFIGGHYTYSNVPLFDWLKEPFHFERNHYDRFGHLVKGFLVIVIMEILVRNTLLTKGWTLFISNSIMLAIAALYEIIEWLSTYVNKEQKTTKEFLGMQGDIWDAQWDMSLTLLGAFLALLLLKKQHDRQLLKKIKSK